MTRTALILGASGRFGRAATDALTADGWTTRRFDRKRDDLNRAAEGADVIVMGANPPYHRWAAEVPALHSAVQAAALRAGARVVLPGNVYVFGPDQGPVWSDDTPHRAENPLGLIRRRLEAGYRDAGVPVLVLRSGDYLDTAPSGNWFDRLMVPALPRGVLRYPGPVDVPHAWAYLPDKARAMADLLALGDALPRFADIPFAGYTVTGADMGQALARVCGRPVAVRPFPWWQLHLLAPFMPVLRGSFEMRYLWSLPHSLDAAPLDRWLPGFSATPLDQALARAVAHLRLPAGPDRPRPDDAGWRG